MQNLNKHDIENLRLQYGDVSVIDYIWGSEKKQLVVKRPNFSEYMEFNKYAANYAKSPNDPAEYQIDEDYVDIFFRKVVIYPQDVDINRIPPGKVLESCLVSVNLCQFEDPKKLRNMYVRAIKHSQSVLGVIMQRLLLTFGFGAFTAIKNLNDDQIMELVVFSEVYQKDLGMFAKVCALPDIPFDYRGRLDVKSLIGYDILEEQQTPNRQMSPAEQKLKDKARKYYRNQGLSEDRIAEILNEREQTEQSSTQQPTQPNNGKIDVNNMSDEELSKMPYDQYQQLKKDGKLMSYEESQKVGISQAKTALAQKIAEDKAKFGDRDTKERNFKGNLDDLLQHVKQKVRDIE